MVVQKHVPSDTGDAASPSQRVNANCRVQGVTYTHTSGGGDTRSTSRREPFYDIQSVVVEGAINFKDPVGGRLARLELPDLPWKEADRFLRPCDDVATSDDVTEQRACHVTVHKQFCYCGDKKKKKKLDLR